MRISRLLEACDHFIRARSREHGGALGVGEGVGLSIGLFKPAGGLEGQSAVGRGGV
jgi:hypothetical protein